MPPLVTHMSYDEVPYDGGLIEETHPDHFAAIGLLFGMTPPPVDTCRVLEIGCASGGNLVPMAHSLPGAQFVGMDPAGVQLEAARSYAERLGVTNATFIHGDIRDFLEWDQRFDYIICHGVFSWVSDDVRQAILAACGRLLSPQGIALVSYNTLPGFYGRAAVRDAMRFHANYFPETGDRISQARAFLEFLNDATGRFRDANSVLATYAELVSHEHSLLQGSQDSYIAHEHLEDENTPYYFHQFAEMLEGHRVQYLGDSQFESMLVQNLPQDVASAINEIAANQVILEQYRDFVVNRSFRKSLLCKAEVVLERNISTEAIAGLKVRGRLVPPGEEPWRIARPGGTRIDVTDPAVVSVLEALAGHAPRTLTFEELLGSIASAPGFAEAPREHLAAILLTLFAHGAIEFRTSAPEPATKITSHPRALDAARMPGRRTVWITTPFHTTLLFDQFVRYMVPLLDGSRNIAEIGLAMSAAVEAGELTLETTDPALKPSASDIARLVVDGLEQLRFHGVLSA